MKKTVEIIVGEKVEGEVDPSKIGPSAKRPPILDEVAGHYPTVYLFECWRCETLCRAWGDTSHWTYVRCAECYAINKI